jgi:RNA polymerase sigma factor (sigma-70 family)
VQRAADTNSPEARTALDALCRRYWHPLYAFVRCNGFSPPDAQDLTQGFFLQLLKNRDLDAVDPRKGKFRSFLLASLKHYLANARDRARAQKRGGGVVPISIDEQDAEGRLRLEPADRMTPEKAYERRWALAVIDQALAKLREEYAAAGRLDLFEPLKAGLTGEEAGLAHAEIGRRLDMSPGAVKVAAHRLRRRFRDILRAEIADTVSQPGEIEEEIRHLYRALSTPAPFSP